MPRLANAPATAPYHYHYRARDAQGALQVGSIPAASERAALAQLQAKGLQVIALTAAHTATGPAHNSPAPKANRPPSAAQRIQLLQELATLLSAGVPLGEAAPSLRQAYAATTLAPALEHLRTQVQTGHSLAAALASSPLGLDAATLAMVEAGEAAGHLAQALEDAATQLDYERRVREEFKSALIYPAVLVGAGTTAVLGIFLIVVPRFASLLKGRHADIPTISRWVIEGGLYFQQHWLAVSLLIAGSLAALALALRQRRTQQHLLQWLARLPVAGPWLRQAEIGRWATLLASLLTHRVPLLQALALSAKSLRLDADRARLALLHDELRRGRALSDALADAHWIAPTHLNLLRVGERSGQLPPMLTRLGTIATEQARLRMQRLLQLIEPLAILLIGGIIGFIMVAVILAITSLNTAKL